MREKEIFYKQYRIHTRRLPSGPWLSMIVNVGKHIVTTKHALTATVTRVPGEYEFEDKAIQAARAYIDEEAGDAAE